MATRKKQAEISIFWRPDWTVNKPLNTFQSVGATLCGVWIGTELSRGWYVSRTSLKRLCTIEEIDELVAFLATEDSRYITGAKIVIVGGSTLLETFDILHA